MIPTRGGGGKSGLRFERERGRGLRRELHIWLNIDRIKNLKKKQTAVSQSRLEAKLFNGKVAWRGLPGTHLQNLAGAHEAAVSQRD